jgi:hypothetical protein
MRMNCSLMKSTMRFEIQGAKTYGRAFRARAQKG